MVTLNAYGRGVCDGVSMAPDFVPGSVKASAAHDPGYVEMASITEAWKDEPFNPGKWKRDWLTLLRARNSKNWTAADVRQLFDDIFASAMAEGGGGIFTYIYHFGVRLFGGIYHASAIILIAVLISGCSGCGSWRDLVDWTEGLPDPVKLPPVELPSDSQPPPETKTDAVEFSSLQWRYGGFDGSRAQLSTPRLSSLTLRNGNRIYYRWDVSLSGWGLADSNAGAIACIFFLKDNQWTGGKFDWVSTSRTDRELKHVQSYSNWPASGITLPWNGPIAYLVVSSDGKRRSNIVAILP